MNPAIVVSAYNRPQALSRLLDSLQKASYPQGLSIPLVISVDQADDNQDVKMVAENFDWPYGPKDLFFHEKHLGLYQHFFACGNLTDKYGSIIFLEDDLLVSPVFYDYASQALACYQNDGRIAGISLYALWFNGYTLQPFTPLADECDAFFLQLPYTQGEAFTQSQWKGFTNWLSGGDRRLAPTDPLHPAWSHFRPDEWFPLFTKYTATTGRFFVFPRVSLTTGYGDAGTHFRQASHFFQAPLQYGKTDFQFKTFDQSDCVYDSFFEILPERLNRLVRDLEKFDYTVDLNATKSKRAIDADYALTSRLCRHPLLSFGKEMIPPEANVIEAISGDKIFLCKSTDLRWDWFANLIVDRNNYRYASRAARPGRLKRGLFALLDILEKLGFRITL